MTTEFWDTCVLGFGSVGQQKKMLPASFLKNFTGEGLTGAACDGSRNIGEERIPPALLHLGVARMYVSHGPGGCCPARWTIREVNVSEMQELSHCRVKEDRLEKSPNFSCNCHQCVRTII